jgi:hypothetical protein
MEDREWMYMGRLGQGHVTNEWINKTDAFLERAFGEGAKGASKIFASLSKHILFICTYCSTLLYCS